MSFPDFVDLTSDDEVGEADLKGVKKEPGLVPSSIPSKEQNKAEHIQLQRFAVNRPGQEPEENGLDTTQSSLCELDQESPTVDSSSFASTLPPAPICRQFWKAGSYHDTQVSENSLQSGHNHLRVHPKFLHSNATSHKWAFGAVAELLDNAFDEIRNGATFVMVDKTSNPRDGSQALLIQDDGGGMDPESMRHCMSFGFSEKKSKLAIGQYGNGFKTSTMRLGADVIVFSRHNNQRTLTQSVGLLSYTFLRQTGHDRIVVPMVDFQFSHSAGKFESLVRFNEDHFSSNLSTILQWSPYRTKAELMKQFDGIGHHGTKVIVYNLWFSDDGDMELDFESDAEDILLRGAPEAIASSNTNAKYQQHIATRLHYSLRVYLSILYLRVPEHFRIILRGRVVEHHNIADDLKYPQFIMYRPSQVGVDKEALVVTTIGFLKDAPHVNIHGFSVYHKNRLIMPFWRVINKTNCKGRGVAGVLEANFIEPIHNKQEFERTTLFQKLETRLKDMTAEYWDLHCRLIGYHQIKKFVKKRNRLTNQQRLERSVIYSTIECPGVVPAGEPCRDPAAVPSQLSGGRQGEYVANFQPNIQPGLSVKRKEHGHMVEPELVKRQAQSVPNTALGTQDWETQPANCIENVSLDQGTQNILQENERLHAECSMYEKREEELNLKVQQLRVEVMKTSDEYRKLLAESRLLDAIKEEKM